MAYTPNTILLYPKMKNLVQFLKTFQQELRLAQDS